MEIKNPFESRTFTQGLEKLASSWTPKVADYKLPEDPAQWNASIQDAIQSQLPSVVEVSSNPHIVYKNHDWGAKCALGSISLAVGETLLVFPVIIRYGQLAPFDVVYVHNTDKWMQASEQNMRKFEAANRNSVFGAVTTKNIKGDNEYEDRWEYLKAPRGFSYKGARLHFLGKRKTATYPVEGLSEVMDYMRENPGRIYYTSKQAQRLFKMAYDRVKTMVDEFSDHPVLGEKVASIQFNEPEPGPLAMKVAEDWEMVSGIPEFAPQIPKDTQNAVREYLEEVDEDIDTDSFKRAAFEFFDGIYIKKVGLNDYIAKLGRRGFDGVFTIRGDVDKFSSYITGGDRKAAEKVLDAVDEARELMEAGDTVDSTKGPIEVLGDAAVVNDIDRVTSFGVYDVFTENGERESGYVMPVIDWTGEETPWFLFRSDNVWALESNINGKISPKACSLPSTTLTPESIGAFVYDKGGRGIVFPPIKIKHVTLSSGKTVVRGVDLGTREGVNIILSGDVPSLMPITHKIAPNDFLAGHINVYMPSAVRFVPLPHTTTKIAAAEEAARRIDAKFASSGDATMRVRKNGNAFYLTNNIKLAQYPPVIARIMKDAELQRYTESDALSAKEAEFVMTMGGAIMPAEVIELSKEGSTDVPVVAPDVLEAKLAGAAFNNAMGMQSRLKVAAKDLRPSMRSVLDVVTMAPGIKKHADEILTGVLSGAPWVGENLSRIKGASIDDKPSLDDLFELGFLDDQSLTYYTDRLQDVEEMEDFLCKILIATRIAGLGMEEDSAQNALYGISDLKNVLERLSFRINRTD